MGPAMHSRCLHQIKWECSIKDEGLKHTSGAGLWGLQFCSRWGDPVPGRPVISCSITSKEGSQLNTQIQAPGPRAVLHGAALFKDDRT